jgi:hypothetical protein
LIQISSKSGVAAPHFDETCIKTQIVEIIRLQKFPYVNIYNEKFIEENPYMRPMRYDYKEDKTIVLEDNEPKLKKQFQIGLTKIKYGYVDLTCDDGADDFFVLSCRPAALVPKATKEPTKSSAPLPKVKSPQLSNDHRK